MEIANEPSISDKCIFLSKDCYIYDYEQELFRVGYKKYNKWDSTIRAKERYYLKKSKLKKSAVYFLIKGNKVVYIGATSNVFHRIQGHNIKDFDYAKCYITENKNPFCIEPDYIAKYKPKYNKRHV